MNNFLLKKIAYINFLKYPAPNIEKKMLAMAHGAIRAGITNIDFININGEKDEKSTPVHYSRFPYHYFPVKYYNFFVNRYDLIQQSIDLKKYDYVILRYCNGDPSGIDFFSNFNIVSEHHTFEVPEYQAFLKSNIRIYDKLARKLRLELEKRYGPLMLQNARGIIGVTNEIAAYELNRIKNKIPSTTISNGITVKQIPRTGFKKFDGKHLDIAFVISAYAPWHGIERLIRSMVNYRGNTNIKLHVIGNIKKSEVPVTSNKHCDILYHGYKAGKDLDSLLKNSNIGISTLGLHKKDMHEACSLKTREYTARGLPFMLAYDDPDLRTVDKNQQFFLKLTNDSSLIDFHQVIDFAESVSKKNELTGYMGDYALTNMDWSVKMQEYVRFIRHIDQLTSSESNN